MASPTSGPAGSQTQAVNIVKANADARAAFIAGSIWVKKTLPSVPLVTNGVTPIQLNNQGGLIAVDLEITLSVHNTSTSTAATLVAGAPYNFFGNMNFVDQSSVTRHNLSMQGMYDYLCFRAGRRTGTPYDAAYTVASGGADYPVLSDPTVPGTIAAGGTATVSFLMHLPIARSKFDTTGMVMLQTGNNNQPAVVNLTPSTTLGGNGNSPYNQPVSILSGTIVPHQCYWQPQAGVVAPPVDTNVQWVLNETAQDNTNIVAGLVKQVLFQTQFKTYCVGIRYYNGSAFTQGTDMTTVVTKTLGGTLWTDDDTPLMRYRRYRIDHGFDCAPGLYWFDFADRPLQYQSVGVWEADFTPATVNAGAYMTYLYEWLKVSSQLATLPGGSQIA